MRVLPYFAFALILAALLVGPTAHAAPCTVPNLLINGQPSDAAQVMANFNSLSACASAAVTPTGSPAAGNITQFSGSSTVTNGDLSGDCNTSGTLVVTCSGLAKTGANQSWTAAQRATPVNLTLATATATPNFDTGQNFSLTLSSACPCTFANPSTTPVAGQTGLIKIVQDATGSRTIGTWGADYVTPGGVTTLSLSAAPNAMDIFSYYVIDSTHIVIAPGALNVVH